MSWLFHRVEIIIRIILPDGQRNILFTDCAQQCWKMDYPVDAMIDNDFLKTL